MEYEVVIGLEIHAQIKTDSKIFCGCSTEFGASPNSQVCPVCLGLPGALPVLNRKVVEMGTRTALALGCNLRGYSVFARKNYFYPDLPKGYQISQFELPFAEHGSMKIQEENGNKKEIGITRIHFEEDAGKNIHEVENSLVDLNRTGVPLMEIVSEPDIRSPYEASEYMKKIHSILVWLDVCDGNMEEGSFRCDANISLRPKGDTKLGTRAELKNVNSFKFIQKALEYEIKRQSKLLKHGEKVVQETRLWNSAKGITEGMRIKEDSNDYRYFPEPDLHPLEIEDDWINDIRSSLPELPQARQERFIREYAVPENDTEVLTSNKALADYFENAVSYYNEPKKISNWIMTELMRELKAAGADIKTCPMSAENLTRLIRMIDKGEISGKIGKSVFEEAYKSGKNPEQIVKDKGLAQISDTGELEGIVRELINGNPNECKAYQEGKKNLLGFFVGEVMKKTRGRANPKMVNELIRKMLEAG